MTDRYSEPVDWGATVWALAIWAAHFSALWAASSVWPGNPTARWIALVATIAAFAGLGWLWRRRKIEGLGSAPGIATAMTATAIGLGAMPALIG